MTAVRTFHTGFYRYVDIAFEWYKAIIDASGESDPHAMDAINAFLARDALVSPEHPFRRAGGDGVELWMVTLINGESRLCFSSKQVEYARYYIKATGLVDYLIPLPSSHYLLNKDVVLASSPIHFTTGKGIKDSIKKISKNNKRLKGPDGLPLEGKLASMRLQFEQIRAAWAAKRGVWCAVDFETWELWHTDVTEFGFSLVQWENGKLSALRDGHWIVEERKHIRNTQYVGDNKDNFCFGKSEVLPLKLFTQRLVDLIQSLNDKDGPLYLIFHDPKGDVQTLKDLRVPQVGIASHIIADAGAKDGVFILDTAEQFAALEGYANDRRSLLRTCALLRLTGMEYMHNAGNDAHWTLQAFLNMVNGQPLDIQREERWPAMTAPLPAPPGAPANQPGPRGLTVQRAVWETADAIDELEELFGAAANLTDPDDDGQSADGSFISSG